MSFLTAALLGMVQGITEFLPVSSTGHLALLESVFYITHGDLAFNLILHLGTMIALFIVYKEDVAELIQGFFCLSRNVSRHPVLRMKKRLAVLVLTATLPLALAVPAMELITRISGSTVLVGGLLLVNGCILYLYPHRVGRKELKEMTPADALLMGLGQAISVLPGISRVATTVALGKSRGISQSYAVRFSFLMSIPGVLGGIVLVLAGNGFQSQMLPCYLVGLICSTVSGYFAIRFVKWLAVRSNFSSFAYYCWGAGIVALILSLVA